ncbi:MAG: hypothetical protein QG583_12 [Patescibacteria group bacterium]|jgi:undecaprenyl pyrophosphate phosphatase UppP|nr:hypothetical protein [Patescibacteria group bacterium]MDQ5954085.1 hypothetical protein [Patescibacteria group bacterium]
MEKTEIKKEENNKLEFWKNILIGFIPANIIIMILKDVGIHGVIVTIGCIYLSGQVVGLIRKRMKKKKTI